MIIMPLLAFVFPTWLPHKMWGELPWTAWYLTIARYSLALHFTWLVNSAAHIWGNKPYDA